MSYEKFRAKGYEFSVNMTTIVTSWFHSNDRELLPEQWSAVQSVHASGKCSWAAARPSAFQFDDLMSQQKREKERVKVESGVQRVKAVLSCSSLIDEYPTTSINYDNTLYLFWTEV